MKNLQLFFLLFIFTALQVYAQPNIEWQTNLGGTAREQFGNILQTDDGGYLVVSSSRSDDVDVSANYGGFDLWLVKTGESGNVEWEQNYGGTNGDLSASLLKTADGGYIVLALTTSDDFDVTNNNGGAEPWLLKFNATGNLEWENCMGTMSNEIGEKLIATNDGGFMIAGHQTPVGGGQADGLLIKSDANGNVEWSQTYQLTLGSSLRDVKQTADGGFIAVGGIEGDFWVVKTDQMGNLIWESIFGGDSYQFGHSVELTSDGGYLIFGSSESNPNNPGVRDFAVTKLNQNGEVQWEKFLGGNDLDAPWSTIPDINGGFIMIGNTESDDLPNSTNFDGTDAWILKIDEEANVLWQRQFGGASVDSFNNIQQTSDGGFIIAGISASSDGDLDDNYGDLDTWIVKLEGVPTDITTIFEEENVNIIPNPSNGNFTITFENEGAYQISIVDILGRQIFYKENQTQSIDVSGITNGIYWVNIVVEGWERNEKVIVQK